MADDTTKLEKENKLLFDSGKIISFNAKPYNSEINLSIKCKCKLQSQINFVILFVK